MLESYHRHQKSNELASYIMPAWSISSSFKVLMCLCDLLLGGWGGYVC